MSVQSCSKGPFWDSANTKNTNMPVLLLVCSLRKHSCIYLHRPRWNVLEPTHTHTPNYTPRTGRHGCTLCLCEKPKMLHFIILGRVVSVLAQNGLITWLNSLIIWLQSLWFPSLQWLLSLTLLSRFQILGVTWFKWLLILPAKNDGETHKGPRFFISIHMFVLFA